MEEFVEKPFEYVKESMVRSLCGHSLHSIIHGDSEMELPSHRSALPCLTTVEVRLINLLILTFGGPRTRCIPVRLFVLVAAWLTFLLASIDTVRGWIS